MAKEKQHHQCDERTTEWFKKQPPWYVCGLAKCEKCGLMYNPTLGHVCPEEPEELKEKQAWKRISR